MREIILAALNKAFAVPHRRGMGPSLTDLATDLAPDIEAHVATLGEMRGFAFTFRGFYLQASAVVIARDRFSANALLLEQLPEGLRAERDVLANATVREFSLASPNVPHLWDGDY